MKLGVANERGSQGVGEVREGRGNRDIFLDVGHRGRLVTVEVLNLAHDSGEDAGSVRRPTALGACRRKRLAWRTGSDHVHGVKSSPVIRANGVHIMGESCVP